MNANEKFCLKWNDFESSLSRSFKELRSEADLIDVWLCSEAGEREEAVPVAAHRLVLSACSGVLRRLLRRKSPGPSLAPGVVYLRGVTSQDLHNIVSFMYDGEVSIAQDQLNSFLAAAEDLQVKGLTQDKSDNADSQKPTRNSQSNRNKLQHLKPSSSSSRDLSMNQIKQPRMEEHDIQEIKSEPSGYEASDHGQGELVELETGQELDYGGGGSEDNYASTGGVGFEDQGGVAAAHAEQGGNCAIMPEKCSVDKAVKITGPDPADLLQYIERNDLTGVYQCTICFNCCHKSRSNVRNHVESKHFPNTFQYRCPLCEHQCSSQQALLKHKSQKHRNHKSLV